LPVPGAMLIPEGEHAHRRPFTCSPTHLINCSIAPGAPLIPGEPAERGRRAPAGAKVCSQGREPLGSGAESTSKPQRGDRFVRMVSCRVPCSSRVSMRSTAASPGRGGGM
jgi:hypothetical protein